MLRYDDHRNGARNGGRNVAVGVVQSLIWDQDSGSRTLGSGCPLGVGPSLQSSSGSPFTHDPGAPRACARSIGIWHEPTQTHVHPKPAHSKAVSPTLCLPASVLSSQRGDASQRHPYPLPINDDWHQRNPALSMNENDAAAQTLALRNVTPATWSSKSQPRMAAFDWFTRHWFGHSSRGARLGLRYP